MNRYYSTHRPIDIGTCPTAGMVNHVNYDTYTYIECINHKAWGYVEYDRELTPQEISDYELTPEPTGQKITLSEYELWTLNECIIAKIDELKKCYHIATTDGTKRAIRQELKELQALNDRICRAAEQV